MSRHIRPGFKKFLVVLGALALLISVFVGYRKSVAKRLRTTFGQYHNARSEGRYEDALAALERYEWYASLPGYRHGGGDGYAKARRRVELLAQLGRGEVEINELLQNHPEDTHLIQLRAVMHFRQGNQDLWETDLARVIELDPTAISAIQTKSRYLAADKPEEAVNFLTAQISRMDALAKSSTGYTLRQVQLAKSRCQIELAHSLLAAGTWDGVFELLDEAARKHETDFDNDALKLFARSALNEGEIRIAEHVIGLLARRTNDAFTVGLQGALLVHQQQPERASDLLKQALDTDPSLDFVHEYLTRARMELGLEDPFVQLEQALSGCENNPDNDQACKSLFQLFDDPHRGLSLLVQGSQRPDLMRRSFSCMARHAASFNGDISTPFITGSWCLFPEAERFIENASESTNSTTRARALLSLGIRKLRQSEAAFAVQNDGLGDPDEMESMKWSLTNDVRVSLKGISEPRSLQKKSQELFEQCLADDLSSSSYHGLSTVGEKAQQMLRFSQVFGIGSELRKLQKVLQDSHNASDINAGEITIVHVENLLKEVDECVYDSTEFISELVAIDAWDKTAFVAISNRSRQSYLEAWAGNSPMSFQHIKDAEGVFLDEHHVAFLSLVCVYAKDGRLVFRGGGYPTEKVRSVLETLHSE